MRLSGLRSQPYHALDYFWTLDANLPRLAVWLYDSESLTLEALAATSPEDPE